MRFFLTIIAVVIMVSCALVVRADEYDDIGKKLGELKHSLELSQKATSTNVAELTKLNLQLQAIKTQVINLESAITQKEKEVKDGEEALAYQKSLLDQRAISYYKSLNKNSFGVIELLISADIARSLENFFYQKSVQDEDRRIITKVVLYITDLEDKKTSLQNQQTRLSAIKEEVNKESKFMADEVTKSKAYESQLKSQIASLSARQQEIIAQKQGSLNIPKTAGSGTSGCVDGRNMDPGFSPRIAFFTYGVPNRVGLNQYGAFGRSKAGQNAETILQAYYASYDLKKDYSQDIPINVDGYGSYKIEDYLKHLGEMPESWGNDGGFEALKAQAIAARSYALAYTNNGQSSICATDRCQVFLSNEKGGKWNEAVESTKGWVMVQGGNPVKAWFSSTHGGYIHSSGDIGWSGTSWTKNAKDFEGDVGSFGDLLSKAYDRSSPWFYCDWGSRASYNKTAWLKTGEVADIVNIILLVKRDSGTSIHLYQPDTANPAGSDTWDADRVKSELRNRGGTPFDNITDVSVSADFGSGKSSSVTVSGDGRSESFNAAEFKDWFNLRAPANIQIVGPLFNAEKR